MLALSALATAEAPSSPMAFSCKLKAERDPLDHLDFIQTTHTTH